MWLFQTTEKQTLDVTYWSSKQKILNNSQTYVCSSYDKLHGLDAVVIIQGLNSISINS